MTSRHRWGEPARFLYKTERTCLRCGLCKVMRHEPTATWSTWIEWWRDGERIKSERTPECTVQVELGTEPNLAPVGAAPQGAGGMSARFPAYPQALPR